MQLIKVTNLCNELDNSLCRLTRAGFGQIVCAGCWGMTLVFGFSLVAMQTECSTLSIIVLPLTAAFSALLV